MTENGDGEKKRRGRGIKREIGGKRQESVFKRWYFVLFSGTRDEPKPIKTC